MYVYILGKYGTGLWTDGDQCTVYITRVSTKARCATLRLVRKLFRRGAFCRTARGHYYDGRVGGQR